MFDALSDSQRAILRFAAVAGGAAALLWLLNREPRRPSPLGASSSAEERDKLVPILRELSRRFFNVCMDVASVAKTVRAKIEARKVDIADETLKQQLSQQCQVIQKLHAIQTEVAQQFGCTPEDIQELQLRHLKDREVRAFAESLQTMLDEALDGQMPVLPNVRIPEALTEVRVLEILAEVYAAETKKVLETVGGKQVSVRDLGEVLSRAHRDAWEEVLEAHRGDVPEGREVYHSTLALYMKIDDFAEKRRQIDEAHQQRMMQLFQADTRAKASHEKA